MASAYELVWLANGSVTIRSNLDGETFHPVAGPVAEAEELYARQLELPLRIRDCREGPFVIWDVGLGAAANVITALRATTQIPAALQVVSFDRTTAALEFALNERDRIGYLAGFERPVQSLLSAGAVQFRHGALDVHWRLLLGDFPRLLQETSSNLVQTGRDVIPPPHVIFYDAFSPARNPEMWTLPVWSDLWNLTQAAKRPCSLATFSRSTMARVTMLRAGFCVGRGSAVAGKEETTVAATELELIKHPLDAAWLHKVRRSHSADPLESAGYLQRPLSSESWAALMRHPQFQAAL